MLRCMNGTSGPDDVLGLVGSTIEQVRFDACVDAGGFGLIYRGYHEGLGETVAIKCLRVASIQQADASMREALAGRFRDETRLLYRLSQGSLDIVRCISSGTLVAPATNEYTPYMVLEWLEGSTLGVELKERRAQGLRPRTLEAAVQLLDSAVGGLAYAHSHDVVHRDVKPGNLFLTRTREGVRLKVLDFGLAKILSDETIGVRPSVKTGVGVHFCSPSYGAPEQFSSKLGKVGPSTDVYSLALVLLEIMTGDKVRPASSLADGLVKAVDPKTGSPSGKSLGLHLPAAVEAVLLRAVAQNPLDRPSDAGTFWSALKEAMAAAPKPNLAMPTVMDDGLGDAMKQVRAAQQSAAPPADPAAAARPRASPFAGTMLMNSAPPGAPHLGDPAAGVSRGTAPLKKPDAPMQTTLPIGAMSPLAASASMPQPHGGAQPAPQPHGGAQPAPQPHPMQRNHPAHGASPGGQPPASGSGATNGARTSRPTSNRPVAKPSPGGIIFIVLCVALAAVGITFYWMRMR